MTIETLISNFITSAVMDRHQSRYFIDMYVCFMFYLMPTRLAYMITNRYGLYYVAKHNVLPQGCGKYCSPH